MDRDSSLFDLLEELLKWPKWHEYKQDYLNKVLPNLKHVPGYGLPKERELMKKIEAIATAEEWEHLEDIAESIHCWKVVKDKLESGAFEEARALLTELVTDLPDSAKHEFQQRYKQELEKQVAARLEQQVEPLLERCDFDAARQKYEKFKRYAPNGAYHELEAIYEMRCRREQEMREIQSLLERDDFPGGDNLFAGSSLIDKRDYEGMKAPHVARYLSQILKIDIDEDKGLAVGSTDRNILVTARAGSGKTTAIGCKTAMLMDKYSVSPDEIMILAFNTDAANQIRRRIREKYGFARFSNARTFHSLAYQLVQSTEELLSNEKEDVAVKKLDEFVQKVWKSIWRPLFRASMYLTFRKELQEIEELGLDLRGDDYYLFRRKLPQVTLKGETVKSDAEKYIADFLTEHDISYEYEKVHLWDHEIYRPDFTVYYQEKEFIIEHWGIDEHDPTHQVPEGWTQDWQDYRAEMERKRDYWRRRRIPLIETSVRDLRGDKETVRERFEEILKQRLKKRGIACHKLNREEIEEEIVTFRTARITKLFVQFIQRAKRAGLKPQDIKPKIRNERSKRTRVFLRLACRVYAAYEEALKREGLTDFDNLLMNAVQVVEESRGDCRIRDRKRKCDVSMNHLRWIMIDEYQDFSKLFYHLIEAIRRWNGEVRLFCVGDDWQAINSFAGSDLHYFGSFGELFEGTGTVNLLTNRRSNEMIVECGNALMKGRGAPGCHLPEKTGGEVIVEYIDDTWIELRNDEEFAKEREADQRFLLQENDLLASRYLKRCHQIIVENPGKSVAILSRTNTLNRTDHNSFSRKLKQCLGNEDRNRRRDYKTDVSVATVHKFKGLEADIVIVLNVCERAFPLIHPDNALFTVFGQTPEKTIEEERRLFYVAVTRAKEKLWLLTEKDRESPFLEPIKLILDER